MSLPLPDSFRQVRFRCDEDDIPELFYVVTACNPNGVPASDEANRQADQRLSEAIDGLGCPSFRVTGGNFDFSHEEPGWGIECSRDEARALAAAFQQIALYEVRRDMVILLATEEPNPREEEIGEWWDRLDDGEPACPFCLARTTYGACSHLLTTLDSWDGSWGPEDGFLDAFHDELKAGDLVAPPGDEAPSEEEEEHRTTVICETCEAIADVITYQQMDSAPGYSSTAQLLWVRDPATARTRLRELFSQGGAAGANEGG